MERESERLALLQSWTTKKLANELPDNVSNGTGDLGEFEPV